MAARKYWVGLNIVPAIGPAKVRALLDHFGDLESAWHADAGSLGQAGLDRRAIRNLVKARTQLDLDAEMAKLAKHQVTAITWEDEAYYLFYGEGESGYSQSIALQDGVILTIGATIGNHPDVRSSFHAGIGKADVAAIRWKPVRS